MEISTYSESIENDKMEASINDDWLSEYMAFVVDPVIFEKNNLLRLGYDDEIIKESIYGRYDASGATCLFDHFAARLR